MLMLNLKSDYISIINLLLLRSYYILLVSYYSSAFNFQHLPYDLR